MKDRDYFRRSIGKLHAAMDNCSDPQQRGRIRAQLRVLHETKTSWERGVLRSAVIAALENLQLGSKDAAIKLLQDALKQACD